MTWVRTKRAIVERRDFGGVNVEHVIGWVGVRSECGCRYVQGRRLDDDEPTMGVTPCDQHGAQTRRAFETFALMPPSDRVAFELWQELLDREILGY